VSNLITLDLSGNSIQGLATGTVEGLANLNQLDLSGNRIETVCWIFQGLVPSGGSSPLIELDLSNNTMEELHLAGATNCLAGYDALQVLRLAQNEIESVEMGVLDDLPVLLELDLSGNEIELLEEGFFGAVGDTLEVLLLGGNTGVELGGLHVFGGGEGAGDMQLNTFSPPDSMVLDEGGGAGHVPVQCELAEGGGGAVVCTA
jgi:hypothetical protein